MLIVTDTYDSLLEYKFDRRLSRGDNLLAIIVDEWCCSKVALFIAFRNSSKLSDSRRLLGEAMDMDIEKVI